MPFQKDPFREKVAIHEGLKSFLLSIYFFQNKYLNYCSTKIRKIQGKKIISMYENMKNKDSPSELISTYFKQVYTASSENPVVVIL